MFISRALAAGFTQEQAEFMNEFLAKKERLPTLNSAIRYFSPEALEEVEPGDDDDEEEEE